MKFNMIDVGALPAEPERFYRLLDHYPGSKVHAFEVDEKLCEDLNKDSRKDIRFYPIALAHCDRVDVTLHHTAHPMCNSIYKPIQKMIDLFEGLEAQTLVKTSNIAVRSLDNVVDELDLGPIDFIKIDAQGASMPILLGAPKLLSSSVLAVLCEAELIPLYEHEPTIGHISAILETLGFLFVKMVGTEGRKLKEVGLQEIPLWTNVLFMKNVLEKDLDQETAQKLLVLLEMYDVHGWTPYLQRMGA